MHGLKEPPFALSTLIYLNRKLDVVSKMLFYILGVVHKLRWQDLGFFFDRLPPSVVIFYLKNVD